MQNVLPVNQSIPQKTTMRGKWLWENVGRGGMRDAYAYANQLQLLKYVTEPGKTLSSVKAQPSSPVNKRAGCQYFRRLAGSKRAGVNGIVIVHRVVMEEGPV